MFLGKKTSCEGNADKGKGFSAMSSKFKAKQEEYLTITLHCFDGNNYLISQIMMNTNQQEEEDEKLKKPKTIDAKEAQKVKERKKKELEDVS